MYLKTLGYSNKVQGKNHIVLAINCEICYDNVVVGNFINGCITTIADKIVKQLPKA